MSAVRRPGRYARTFAAPALHRSDVGTHMIEVSAGPGAASYGRLYPGGEIRIFAAAACHTFPWKVVAR